MRGMRGSGIAGTPRSSEGAIVKGVGENAKERVTRPRILIAQVLKDASRFVSAQQIIGILERRNLKVGTATVYRNLKLMVERGEVDAIHVEGETLYRECSDGGHHHHVICRMCGRTVEIEIPGLEQWIDKVMARLRYRGVDHDLEMFGVCPECARSQNKADGGGYVAKPADGKRSTTESDNRFH